MALTEEFFERLAKSLGEAVAGGDGDDDETKKAAEKEAADKKAADEKVIKDAADLKAKEEAEAAAQKAAEVPEAIQKTIDALGARIELLEKTLTSDEDGSLRSVITTLATEVENTREALGKGLDTLKAVVDRTVVKKSLPGDDGKGDGDGNVETDDKKLEKAADDAFEQGILTMLKTGQPLVMK